MQVEMLRIDGRLVSIQSEEGKERLKWERPANYNPNAPENQFPCMLYKAAKRPDGVIVASVENDSLLGNRPGSAEEFTRRCQLIVGSPKNTYEQNMKLLGEAMERGWRKTQFEAIALLEAKDEARSTEAAHRHYDDRNLSEKAQAEIEAAEAASPEHLPVIPEKRRGRKPGSKNKPKLQPVA